MGVLSAAKVLMLGEGGGEVTVGMERGETKESIGATSPLALIGSCKPTHTHTHTHTHRGRQAKKTLGFKISTNILMAVVVWVSNKYPRQGSSTYEEGYIVHQSTLEKSGNPSGESG